MRKILFFIVGLIMLNSVFALQYPWIGNCQLQGYNLTYEKNSSNSYCIFDGTTKCDAEEFYGGECGQEFVKEISCGNIGERVHSQLQSCCSELEKFHYPKQKGGGDICREPLGFFSNVWEKIKFFFTGQYF